jgi:sigma-B regulation protein RsbU (phosphoserine phosphatase)
MPRNCPSFPRGTPPGESALRFHRRFAPKGVVSGDFYDFKALSETNAGVFICDVMGHGVGAALVTAVIRGMLVEISRATSDPSEVLAEINRALVPIMRHAGAPMFASAFYMTADAASGEIQYANAGHPNPFVVRRDLDRIERIGAVAHGPALGLMEEARYRTGRSTLARRDLVMMFTDGIFEVDGADETLFGEERLLGAVRRRIHLPSEQLFEELLEEVREYSLSSQFEDDICLLGMEVDHFCRSAGPINCQ